MSFHFIPRVLHEVLGLIMFAMLILHFVWNRRAFSLKKPLFLIIDVAMMLCMIIIIFTGVCISNYLFNGMIDMRLQRNIWIHQLHVSIPFVFMILSGLHLGLHWREFWQRIKNLIHLNTNSMFYKVTSRLLIIILIIAGIYGSILNRIGDRLTMQHIFATEATDLPFAAFALLMIGVFTIYIVCGVLINKLKNKS